ncbi:MAG: polyprenyl synthetase family protein [Bacteroidetes bacterium]|nr:polyprenyl synthetase family protein [Flavobacteriaceae bacterium]MDA0330454.1 polyprenyl synthetase family protein [Bacteroidota bacterium]MDA0885191.1 polyprenyl synthetase family protein [Bacteroidota bacterium]MDA1226012.1 polyprenyl synthetase family protein [Bacteroidota bacterium]
MKNLITNFESFLKSELIYSDPTNLYQPVKYILESGGKRLRPLITMNICDILSNDLIKALPASASLEIFHNFTLAHDDIMDNSLMRRGRETLHSKWNINTGILSGDVMLIISYEFLKKYDDLIYIELSKQLIETSRLLCEGQQYDIDFSSQDIVAEDKYFKMIQNKTAELIACAYKFGGIVSNTKDINKQILYEIGLNLGIAFQLEDDLLDCFGDEKKFGKRIGGDIIEKKKTLLYINTIQNLSKNQRIEFEKTFYSDELNEKSKINLIKTFYQDSGSVDYLKQKVKEYSDKASYNISQLDLDTDKKNQILNFSRNLLDRQI